MNFFKLTLCGSLLFLTSFAHSQSITLISGQQDSALVCPTVKPRSVQVNPSFDGAVLEPPDDVEIATLNLSANTTQKNENSSSLLSKLGSSPLRIALWGDSHAAARFFSDELVKSFVLNSNDVLPTFIPPLIGRAGVRLPLNKTCLSTTWKYEYAYRSKAGGNFAKGLAKMTSDVEDSYLWVDFSIPKAEAKLRSLNILFTSSDSSSPVTVALSIDDGPEQEVLLDKTNLGILKINSDKNFSILKLRLVGGALNLDGFIPTYSKVAAVYFDTFGIPGATGLSWKNINSQYFLSHGYGDPYDLVIFEYGTNEGNQKPFNLEAYSSNLRAQLSNMRQIYPQAACIMMGPTDRGILVKRVASRKKLKQAIKPQELLTFSKIHHEISQAQKNIGRDFDCSFWSWQDEMGGIGGAYKWIRHSPPLMAKDLIHLTVDGYQQSARDFSKNYQLKALNK